jgi:hypothetical protein
MAASLAKANSECSISGRLAGPDDYGKQSLRDDGLEELLHRVDGVDLRSSCVYVSRGSPQRCGELVLHRGRVVTCGASAVAQGRNTPAHRTPMTGRGAMTALRAPSSSLQRQLTVTRIRMR